jgi:hypothetical protein
MIKLDLFLELFYSTNHLLEGGLTKTNIQEVRCMMNYSFDRFDKLKADVADPDTIIEGIAFKLLKLNTPKEYVQVLNVFQSENEICLQALPKNFIYQSIDEVQLLLKLFTILNDLLEMGMTSCHIDAARMKIKDLFDDYITDEMA